MEGQSANYVSFNTMNWFFPLFDLMDRLRGMKLGGSSEVQANAIDNGYSSAIIVLAVTVFESAVTRFRYCRKELAPNPKCAEYFRKLDVDHSLRDDVDEMVAVRDALIHSHVYPNEVYWDKDLNFLARRPFNLIRSVFGNKRYDAVVTEGAVTKNLKLNLVSTRVCRKDACVVLRIVDMVLDALESLAPGYLPVRETFVTNGWPKTFHERVEEFDLAN